VCSSDLSLQQAIEDLTIWNNSPRKFLAGLSPLAVYRQSVEATQSKQRVFNKVIDIEAFYTLPGEHKKIRTMDEGNPKLVQTFIPQTYEYTNKGIEIVVSGKRSYYDIEDASFRARFIGTRFSIKHEPNPERWTNGQPECVLLYLQGAPLQWQGVHAALLPKERYHMAVADYRQGERAELGKHLELKKKQRALVQSDFTQLIEKTKTDRTYTPVITDNAFDKQVLQDTNNELLNQIIQREDYRIGSAHVSDGPTDDSDDDDKNYDRLSGYDQDEIL
jgi:hypothetical protein